MKVIAISLTLLAVLGVAIYWFWSRDDEIPEGLIQASGRIEGDQIIRVNGTPLTFIVWAALQFMW
jgi:hypothetical protein